MVHRTGCPPSDLVVDLEVGAGHEEHLVRVSFLLARYPSETVHGGEGYIVGRVKSGIPNRDAGSGIPGGGHPAVVVGNRQKKRREGEKENRRTPRRGTRRKTRRVNPERAKVTLLTKTWKASMEIKHG